MGSQRSQKTATDAWLLDETKPANGRMGSAQRQDEVGLETSQWLSLPEPEHGQPDARKPEAQSRRGVLGRGIVGQRTRRLAAELRRAEGTIESQREEIAEMRERIEALETELEASQQLRPPRP
jgi:hypothetical protein